MPFNSYATTADVAIAHRIRTQRAEFIEPRPAMLSAYFREELAFTLHEVAFGISESAVCENLIHPLLREVWKPHRGSLAMWSHQPLAYNDDLCGTPDYMISRRSPLGFIVPDQPFFLIVEAKRDDFERGWGQCLAAMRAAQKLSADDELTFFGASTNGRLWSFGRLIGDEFTEDLRIPSINDVDLVAAALNDIMLRCRDQAARLPVGV